RGLHRRRGGADAQLAVGIGDPELLEEHARQLVVVVLSGVDDVLLVAALAQAARDSGRLDELRAVADDGYDAHRSERLVVIIGGMTRSLTSAARAAYSVTSSVARHAAWYVRYQVVGSSRARRRPPRQR